MKFCKKCNNMLYIHSIENTSGLRYVCRNCDYKEDDPNPKRCVYENYYTQQGSTFDIIHNKYMRHDPTLPRMNTMKCINSKCVSNRSDLSGKALLIIPTSEEDDHGIRELVTSVSKAISVLDVEIVDGDVEFLVVVGSNDSIRRMYGELRHRIHTSLEYIQRIEPRIIFIKYDPDQIKYVYICEYCNSSWKR